MSNRFSIRFLRLLLGLFFYGLGVSITINAHIGYAPWEVFHSGIGNVVGMSIGNVSIIAGVAFGVLAWALGERLGLGTIMNMVLIGVFIDIILRLKVIPTMNNFATGVVMLVGGLFVIALGSYFYIGSGFGAGPRDSLMVALNRKTGIPVGYCRAAIEVSVVGIGWLLGGMVGAGTVIAAVAIGFCIQATFKLLRFEPATIQHQGLVEAYQCLRGTSTK